MVFIGTYPKRYLNRRRAIHVREDNIHDENYSSQLQYNVSKCIYQPLRKNHIFDIGMLPIVPLTYWIS